MLKKESLNPLLAKKLQDLKAKNPALIAEIEQDWADLVELNELAENITHPSSDADWLDAPVYIHGVALRPLSLGAYTWLDKRALKWFPADKRPFWSNVAVAYAMAYSRNPLHLRKLRDKATCKSALKAWIRKCGCTYAELLDGIQRVLVRQAAEVDDSKDSKAPEYGPVIALLCSEYGGTPDHWLWKVSTDQVGALLDEYAAKLRREEAATNRSGHKPSNPGYVRACKQFHMAWVAYAKKVEERNG